MDPGLTEDVVDQFVEFAVVAGEMQFHAAEFSFVIEPQGA
jgi:hypothetical protein